MSGTSMDGIDVAMITTDGQSHVEFGPSLAIDYPKSVRQKIESCLADAEGVSDRHDRPNGLKDVEKLITDLHAQACETFFKDRNIDRSSIAAIGFHGQTVLHRPEQALTIQLGDGQELANKVGIDVVYDMRANDMTVGGQGAPLVPVYHQALAAKIGAQLPVVFVNIGGISNITYVGADGALSAFDTGPGNALIDQWVQAKAGIPFDQGGTIASEGNALMPIVNSYMQSEFFKRAGPKSLDRNDFKPLDLQAAELSDGARTLARVTAQSIIRSPDLMPELPKQWIISGGGRLNEVIMADLARLAKDHSASVVTSDSHELNGDMMEAEAFAYLAVRHLRGLPLTFPTTTGCKHPATGGVLAQPQP
jgi:anhydro-N-acetylmuramic acid kinase